MKEVREHVAEGGTSHAIDDRMSDEMLVNGQNAVLTDGSRPAAFPFQMAAEATRTNNLKLIISSASWKLERMVAKERKQSKVKRQALWTRASAYSASKRPDRALADVQNALKLSLDDPGAYIRAAKISADSHRYAQAVEYLNIAEQKLQHWHHLGRANLPRKSKSSAERSRKRSRFATYRHCRMNSSASSSST